MDETSSTGRQETIFRYAAKKLIEDLRHRTEIDLSLQQHLTSYPLFTYCRAEILESDKDILKETASCETATLPLRRFALRLLRQFENDQDVKTFFFTLWIQPFDYEMKIEILWSLLSYKDLPEALFADISKSFNVADWDKWLPLVVEKLEGDQDEKNQVKELMKKFFNL
jgi:hypothetical protein